MSSQALLQDAIRSSNFVPSTKVLGYYCYLWMQLQAIYLEELQSEPRTRVLGYYTRSKVRCSAFYYLLRSSLNCPIPPTELGDKDGWEKR